VKIRSGLMALVGALTLMAAPAQAEPTHIMIRALSQDAKFIGDHTGGVDVTLRDAASGKVLSQGGTGDTNRIMKTPHVRGTPMADAETAGFDAVIDISRPTRVEVEARGPLGQPGAAITVRSAMWVLPGQSILGDGWVLGFPGLVVTPDLTAADNGDLKLNAKVTMMCGCPISPGGVWDEANYRIEADILDRNVALSHVRLTYAGQPSQFTSTLPRPPGRRLSVRVTAIQLNSPNVGVTEIPLP
jgi:hypothetical protein